MKVLVTGDPGGNLSALFKRVTAVNKTNGPFDMLFCVGSFFCHAGETPAYSHLVESLLRNVRSHLSLTMESSQDVHAESAEDTAELSAEARTFTSGSKQAPLPTYFVGSFGSGSTEAMLALSTADTNIHHLGQAGLKTLQGLNVAYLDGTYNEAAYSTDPKDTDSFAGCRHYTQVS